MGKLKLGVIFGGMSTEHEVSVVSGKNILENLDKEKYQVYPIYIDKTGNWFKYIGDYNSLTMGCVPKELTKIDNLIEYLKKMDVVFPVLHGLYGEDGTIQGLLELINIPYVGCRVLASSICMDKVYTKIILEKAGIKQTKSIYIRKNKENYVYINNDFDEETLQLDEICKKIENEIKYPMFVKPSNSGSSVGVSKANSLKSLQYAIVEAAKYDYKILVEEGIEGKEVECAVLGNENVTAGEVGEIKPADEFYSFDAKYNNENSKTIIPANIPEETKNRIKETSIKAFKAINGTGLARVDFFVEKQTGEIVLNEINTMPGFTQISMYPKLMEAHGITYTELLNKLVMLAIEK
ncbi:MAG: D-alanine--D-alanine ligase [Clostridia bacterium]|nr:D-alanine--D-alanine ligase [Clostridia bacterium]